MLLTLSSTIIGLLLLLSHTVSGNIQIEESPAQLLYPLSSYPSIRITRWRVPADTSLARWSVWANMSDQCTENVVINLWTKYSSFPLVSPAGGQLPPQMLPVMERQTLAQFTADTSSPGNNYHTFSIPGPQPGNWYMMGATQQGENLCRVEVTTRAEYIMETNIITIIPVYNNYQDIRTFYTIHKQQIYKLSVPPGAWEGEAMISKCRVRGGDQGVASCPIQLLTSTNTIPQQQIITQDITHQYGVRDTLPSVDCSSLPKSECSLKFMTQESSVQYITITPTVDTPVEFAISVKLAGCHVGRGAEGAMLVNSINTELLCGEPKRRPVKILFHPTSEQNNLDNCGDQVRLVKRKTQSVFDFQFVLAGNNTKREPLILRSNRSTVLSFSLEEGDVGGTLAVELAIYNNKGGSSSEVREVVGCVSHGYRGIPAANNSSDYPEYYCPRGRKISQTRSHTNREITFDQILIPYPASGRWYLSLSSLCYIAGQGRSSSCSTGDVHILFGIHSSSCIRSSCGRYGHCYQYLSGGAIFSACKCIAGHTGPACNDPSQAESDYQLLSSTLLLTTTNLAMLPAIMLALYRAHYSESVVYFSHLVSSCLHHACAQDVYSVCVLHATVLHFCDVLTDILSMWVTLLAMACLPHQVRSVLHMVGTIAVAMAVNQDSNSSFTFLVPSLLGTAIMLVSWFWRCTRDKSCYPSMKYLSLYCLPGLLIGGTGVGCLTFQTSLSMSRYQHSLWHLARGVTIMLLLPDTPRTGGKESKAAVQKNPIKKPAPPDVSFKQLTESNQSSIDDMAVVTRHPEHQADIAGQTQL